MWAEEAFQMEQVLGEDAAIVCVTNETVMVMLSAWQAVAFVSIWIL